jgi:Tol biopolymer transport system component
MPETLVPRADDWSNERPAYSPDGRWIAFNRTGPDLDPDDMGNGNSELMIVGSDGGPTVRLDAANGGVGLGNNWAKWSPPTGGRRQWLAFSSRRDYGHRLINEGGVGRTPQIWVTSVDPETLPGADPSSPAFWLPYQSIESGNHIPYWAVFEKE